MGAAGVALGGVARRRRAGGRLGRVGAPPRRQPGDRFRATGQRSWAHHGRSPAGETIRQVHVYDLAQPLPPESPAAWPAGTRCMLAWSTGLSSSGS